MICPACGAFYVKAPEECDNCHTKLKLCEPCFGSGQVRAMVTTGGDFPVTLEFIDCDECGGRGLIKVAQAEPQSEAKSKHLPEKERRPEAHDAASP